ncbi:hypothetical protein OSB04_005071 [Centaurea solstitialis]|uniref:Uncharacterized protein n=1 Tax=Centaurea solstitialis TaxID=347529 RepID=A0AA38WRW2_9ASTR|nr:hypothetical protein OSB04_005071 [Centaurea solstitialis]
MGEMKMRRLVLFSVVLVSVVGLAIAGSGFEYTEADLASDEAKWALYERWRAHHNKPDAGDAEKQKRFIIFMDTVKRVDAHNKAKQPYTMELNKMADVTFEEVGRFYTGAKIDDSARSRSLGARRNSSRVKRVDRHDIPKEFDWRQQNVVNPPKNQGQCGSCWAFALIGSLESTWAVQKGQLHQLSEQQLVDCWDQGEWGGCNGAAPSLGLEYLAQNGGATTQQDYPYNEPPQRGFCCARKLQNRPVTLAGFETLPIDDEQALLEAVAKQPVIVQIYVYDGFFNYKEGIYTGVDCTGNDNGHAVVAVGWGETPDGVKYWILKNSWGEDWGMKGYMHNGIEPMNNYYKHTYTYLPGVVLVSVIGLARAGSGFEYTEADLESDEAKWAMYERWREHHNKPEAGDDEKHRRFVIFMDTVKRVDAHNKAKQPYTMELNKMADVTFEEVGRFYTGNKLDHSARSRSLGARRNSSRVKRIIDRHVKRVDRQNIPREFDWRQKNVVNPPKNQGQCGSCWAFALIGSLESTFAIQKGQLHRLSEQQLVDCWDQGEWGGCNGAAPSLGLEYLAQNGGSATEDAYPYNEPPQRGFCCPRKLQNRPVQLSGFESVPIDDEKALLEAVAKQPGIYTGADCTGTQNAHAVVAVGWGETPEGVKYWILKNSWGKDWGMDGYMFIASLGSSLGTRKV